MSEALTELGAAYRSQAPRLRAELGGRAWRVDASRHAVHPWSVFVEFLKTDRNCRFSTLVDITAVDYPEREARFDVVYHFLSMYQNHRIRLKLAVREDDMVPSIISVHPSANWFEREVFDMFGILFSGHPDLRRILTDYGFRGHPLRKDFPTTGYTEVRYDEAQKRVVYEPVSLVQEYRQFDFMSPGRVRNTSFRAMTRRKAKAIADGRRFGIIVLSDRGHRTGRIRSGGSCRAWGLSHWSARWPSCSGLVRLCCFGWSRLPEVRLAEPCSGTRIAVLVRRGGEGRDQLASPVVGASGMSFPARSRNCITSMRWTQGALPSVGRETCGGPGAGTGRDRQRRSATRRSRLLGWTRTSGRGLSGLSAVQGRRAAGGGRYDARPMRFCRRTVCARMAGLARRRAVSVYPARSGRAAVEPCAHDRGAA